MANEKRLIDLDATLKRLEKESWWLDSVKSCIRMFLAKAKIVDAYTTEQVTSIIQQADKLEARNQELEKECTWLKSCLNCKIRKECQRHCGKVVHDCDHWEYGDSTVDAVEVVRCRDCKWYKEGELLAPNKFCFRLKHPTEDRKVGYNFCDDDFCSYGERREGE